MLFTEFRFLIFFAVVYSVYWTLHSNRWRKVWLLATSYAFYGAWDWRFLSLIIGSTLVDYVVGLKIDQYRDVPAVKRRWLMLSLGANLGMLAYFKYANFFASSAVDLLAWLGLPANEVTLNIVLPVGISFYTFQTLSYSIDIYAGKLAPQKSFLNLATFVAFFPQLVAGPIVRAADFLPQLERLRSFSRVNLRSCLALFLVGFFKKACISNHLAPISDQYFAAPEAYNALSSWIGVLSYTVQIYCDFSGYSDMALACAGLLGYKLCLNFNFPYFASSITDFWRRWHISLSTWLKDYLYIPLGGNRGGKLFTYRNLMLTMVLGGLWHGAAWTFVIWGFLHGIALIVHKEWVAVSKRLPKVLSTSSTLGWLGAIWSVALTFYWVCITWIFFRADSLASAKVVLSAFVGLRSPGTEQLNTGILSIFILLAAVHWMASYQAVWMRAIAQVPARVYAVVYAFIAALIMASMPIGQAPFVYFQF